MKIPSPAIPLIILISSVLISCNFPMIPIVEYGIPYATGSNQDYNLTGDIYYHSYGPKSPLVIIIHGGAGIDLLGDKSHFTKYAKDLAGRGFAVYNINYRELSLLYPETTADLMIYDFIDDANLAYDFILENGASYNIDTDRIGLIGCSFGAYLALMLGLDEKNDGVKSIISFYSATYMPSHFGYDDIEYPDTKETDYFNWLDGLNNRPLIDESYEDNPQLWFDYSPRSLLDRLESIPPIDIFHGYSDGVVSYNRQALPFVDRAEKLGFPVTLHGLEGDHGFMQISSMLGNIPFIREIEFVDQLVGISNQAADEAWPIAVEALEKHLKL